MQDDGLTTTGSPGRIAILAPMPSELRPLVRLLSLKQSRSGDPSIFWGRLGRVEIAATTTGIGTRAAVRKAEAVLGVGSIGHLVVVGIAGGVGPSVRIGDLVVPELVIDLATGARYRPSSLGTVTPKGTLATSDAPVSDVTEAARLERQGVIAVDMETAAIAAVSERRRCTWSVFRAISDRADDGSTDQAVFGLADPSGEPDLGALLRFVVKTPNRIPRLARLARGLDLATNAAAAPAVRALKVAYAG